MKERGTHCNCHSNSLRLIPSCPLPLTLTQPCLPMWALFSQVHPAYGLFVCPRLRRLCLCVGCYVCVCACVRCMPMPATQASAEEALSTAGMCALLLIRSAMPFVCNSERSTHMHTPSDAVAKAAAYDHDHAFTRYLQMRAALACRSVARFARKCLSLCACVRTCMT